MSRLFDYLRSQEPETPRPSSAASASPGNAIPSRETDETGRFSIHVVEPDGSVTLIAQDVDFDSAASLARRLINSIDAKIGLILGVRVLNAARVTVFHWHWRQGMLVPADP